MSLIQIGLVDKTGALPADLVQATAAALNIQVTRDLPQFWNIQATVLYLPNPNMLPAGVWPVQLVDSLPPGEGGFHTDENNQPFAEVVASPDSDSWTIAASHETLEMLVDPSGNKLHSSLAIEIADGNIQDGTGQVEYLVEACDPCEADQFGYAIQGIAVSDFLTPHFYDPIATPGTRYSFTGALSAPRQILPGGYISWIDPETGDWQQLRFVNASQPPQIVDLGPAPNTGSLREWIDGQMGTTALISKNPTNHALLERCRAHRVRLNRIAAARAKRYARKRAALTGR